MTTIAYRKGVLASDSLRTANGLRDGTATKVWRSRKGHLIGAAGATAPCEKFRDWVNEGMKGACPFEGKDEGNGIVVWPNGRTRCWGQHGAWSVNGTPFYALGWGYQLAMGAMEMGASAPEAVRAAMKHDVGTGGRVQTVRLNERIKR